MKLKDDSSDPDLASGSGSASIRIGRSFKGYYEFPTLIGLSRKELVPLSLSLNRMGLLQNGWAILRNNYCSSPEGQGVNQKPHLSTSNKITFIGQYSRSERRNTGCAMRPSNSNGRPNYFFSGRIYPMQTLWIAHLRPPPRGGDCWGDFDGGAFCSFCFLSNSRIFKHRPA